jgi:coenzyme F420 biosynthesis associated uncharacterized protein
MSVDWDLAVATARRVGGAGPRVEPEAAAEMVAGLREAAALAQHHVAEITGLDAAAGYSPVLVVDRPQWTRANAEAMDRMLAPLVERAAARRDQPTHSGLAEALGRRAAGVEAGVLLGFLSSRILGQFDPFYDGMNERTQQQASGRLLLVAPNIMGLQQSLDLPAQDVSLWVCLHEETHRVQFTAVDWLRKHLLAELDAFVAEAPADGSELLGQLVSALGRAAAATRRREPLPSLLDLVQTPEQAVVVRRLSAVMSLLEGHADVVMDQAGEGTVPTVRILRERFEERRDAVGGLDRVLRRLMGMEGKVRQYRDGARFVRDVSATVGRDGFAVVWSGPDALPTPDEIADPTRWVSRVHG